MFLVFRRQVIKLLIRLIDKIYFCVFDRYGIVYFFGLYWRAVLGNDSEGSGRNLFRKKERRDSLECAVNVIRDFKNDFLQDTKRNILGISRFNSISVQRRTPILSLIETNWERKFGAVQKQRRVVFKTTSLVTIFAFELENYTINMLFNYIIK